MTRSSCHDHQHLPSSRIRKTPNLPKNARFRDWYLVKRASWWSADKSRNKPTSLIKRIFRQMYRWCRRWLLEANKQIQHNDSNERWMMIKLIRKESNKSIKLTKLALNKQANLIQLISGTRECWSWSTTAGCHGGMRDLVANFIISNIYRIFRISTVIDFMNIILMKNVCSHHLNADIFLELYLGFITGSFCASLKWVTDISSRSRIVYSTAAVPIVIICTYCISNKQEIFYPVLE